MSTNKIEIATNRDTGAQGFPGWSPNLASVVDGQRIVLQVADWVGGAGTKPAVGSYISATGLTNNIALATNVRGASEVGDVIILNGNAVIPTFGSKYISGELSTEINLTNITITESHGFFFQVLSTELGKVGIIMPTNHYLHYASARSIGSTFEDISFTTSYQNSTGGLLLSKGLHNFWLAKINSVLHIYIF